MKQEVYKITNNENGKVYVGITIQGVASRWTKHCSDARCNPQFPIHNAIKYYGEDKFTIEVIEELEDEEFDTLKEREKYWIKYFDSHNRDKGYNLTLGGDGSWGRYHSEETKEKIRQKALGRKASEDTRKRMSESHKKREYDHLEMSDRCKKGNKKRWSDPKERLKASINNPRNRKILKFDIEGNFIDEFRSLSEAARSVNKENGHQNISKCAKNDIKSAYGYIWKYKDEIETQNEKRDGENSNT